MATTPPLHGMRIIECSALGPAAITTALVDLGADVIKVEPPAGDYIREMTWPIVEGTSLMHLHLNRGKRSLVLDLRTDAGVDIFKELAADADVVVEAMRPGSLARRGVGFDDLRATNPKLVFCTISGYGMTGPYRDYPSHGIAYDTWAGIVKVATDDEGFAYIPEHVSIGINAGPLFGALGILAAVIRARATGEGSHIDVAQSDAAAAMDWYRSETWRAYERPESEVTGQQGRRLRAARTRDGGHGRRGPLPGLRDVRPSARPLHGLRAGLLEELLRGPRPHGPLRALAGIEVRRPRPRQPRAPGRAARHLRHEDRPGVARFRRTGQHADRAGQHAQDVAGRPAVRRPLPALAGRGSRGGPALHPAALRRRGTAAPGQGSHRRAAHRGGLALRARLRRQSDRRRPRRWGIRNATRRRVARQKGGRDGEGPVGRAGRRQHRGHERAGLPRGPSLRRRRRLRHRRGGRSPGRQGMGGRVLLRRPVRPCSPTTRSTPSRC